MLHKTSIIPMYVNLICVMIDQHKYQSYMIFEPKYILIRGD